MSSKFLIPATGINLSFTGLSSVDEYYAFEFPPDMCMELISNSVNGYEIRGNSLDEACLVSKTSTFSVKLVETSNTVLLMNGNLNVISGVISHYYELIPIQPKLH